MVAFTSTCYGLQTLGLQAVNKYSLIQTHKRSYPYYHLAMLLKLRTATFKQRIRFSAQKGLQVTHKKTYDLIHIECSLLSVKKLRQHVYYIDIDCATEEMMHRVPSPDALHV